MSRETPSTPAGELCKRTTDWTCQRAFLAALLVSILVSFTGVFDHSLWTPDEPRVAGIGREMLVSGDYVVPTVGGKPFLEKPPLYWWVMTGLYRLFGVSDSVARCTSALAGVLALLLVFDLARRVTNPFGGLMATIVTATMGGFFKHFHRVIVDPWLALFVLLGYWGFVVSAFSTREPGDKEGEKSSALGIVVMYLAGGLAFLTKGPIGPALLGGPAIVAVIVGRRWRFFRSWAHVPGTLVFLALCLLWPVMLYIRGGRELLDGFVIHNVLYRFLPGDQALYMGGHKNPPWYYLKGFAGEILPWIVALPAVAHWLWRKRCPREWNRPALLFLASVFPVGLILLSIPGTKRQLYLLPLIAPLGLAVGAWIAATTRKECSHKIDRQTHIIWLVLLPLVAVGMAAAMVAAYFVGESILTRFHVVLRAGPSPVRILVLLGILVIAVLGPAIRGVRSWKRGSTRVGPLTAWMTLALFVLGGSVAYPVIDGFKNLHYMTKGLGKMGVLSPDLAGFRLDEVTRCLIPYDTGIELKDVTDPEALRRHIRENPSGMIIVLERRVQYMPEDVRSRLRLIRKWSYSKHRAYCLYGVAPASPEESETPQP